jgi:hypothetical protein
MLEDLSINYRLYKEPDGVYVIKWQEFVLPAVDPDQEDLILLTALK